MEENKTDNFINPIHHIKASVPPIVWQYIIAKIHSGIKDLALTETRSSSFRITVTNYAEGLRRSESMFQVRPLLKQVLIKALNIDKPHDFFDAEREAMLQYATEVADKMIQDFESDYTAQKAKLQAA